MLLRLDDDDPRPLFLQIAAQVRGLIATGQMKEGDRLPAARDLAEVLGINHHTVLRAYSELRDDGLVDMRRGRGVSVRAGAEPGAALVARVRELADEARRHGLSRADVLRLVEDHL